MLIIEVKGVKKVFKKLVREFGIFGMFKILFSFKYIIVVVVKDILFSLELGEIVGYIGVNGVGKFIMIKMMCGILILIDGVIMIDGYKLYNFKERKYVLNKIGVVFG